MNFLTLEQVLEIHAKVIRLHGGDEGIHDLGLVESAVAQPRATFGGQYLNPTLPEMASALGFSLTSNHGFKDGNKRVGFTATDVFLRLNGHKIAAPVDDAERATLAVASHQMTREELTEWVRQHIVPLAGG
ncbi:MAG: type II toxin-antitoxin system death-on-curing family toxin [Gemmataceae bacterium]|nr:type II toxin-antitoxin system death-on-curing family toxin [Gemmataceae bacterium]